MKSNRNRKTGARGFRCGEVGPIGGTVEDYVCIKEGESLVDKVRKKKSLAGRKKKLFDSERYDKTGRNQSENAINIPIEDELGEENEESINGSEFDESEFDKSDEDD